MSEHSLCQAQLETVTRTVQEQDMLLASKVRGGREGGEGGREGGREGGGGREVGEGGRRGGGREGGRREGGREGVMGRRHKALSPRVPLSHSFSL